MAAVVVATAVDWPSESDSVWCYIPTDEDLARERAYWEEMARIAEYDAYIEVRAQEEALELEDDGWDGGWAALEAGA